MLHFGHRDTVVPSASQEDPKKVPEKVPNKPNGFYTMLDDSKKVELVSPAAKIKPKVIVTQNHLLYQERKGLLQNRPGKLALPEVLAIGVIYLGVMAAAFISPWLIAGLVIAGVVFYLMEEDSGSIRENKDPYPGQHWERDGDTTQWGGGNSGRMVDDEPTSDNTD